MIYAIAESSQRHPLKAGHARDAINQFFVSIGKRGKLDTSSSSPRNPVEERLKYIQDKVSEISMHLPRGFAVGLNRQFANLMDDEAWEAEDELLHINALDTFLMVLRVTKTIRRPGIGTNGRGSITASWTEGANRLTIECLPSKRVTMVVSRAMGALGEIERAAFGEISTGRILEILTPFGPEVWLDR
jgi:hypothetical protein